MVNGKSNNFRLRPSLKPTKILYFTDAHNDPFHPIDRFGLLCAFANKEKPDAIVDGGDFDDFESVCMHVGNDTVKGKLKPTLKDDLEASAKAHKFIKENLDPSLRKFKTLGNHEVRLWTYENNVPETSLHLTSIYENILESTGWNWCKYGDWINLYGIDFTHVPFNAMGRPVGGKQPHVTLANSLVKDLCFGHTHAFGFHVAHKMGPSPGRSVRVLNGGCFMPEGYVPDYALHAHKSFWHGLHVLYVLDEKIVDLHSISLGELERMAKRGEI